jgi:hypothetical protein
MRPHLTDDDFRQQEVSTQFGRRDRRPISPRAWSAMFGLPIESVAYVWDSYCQDPLARMARQAALAPTRPIELLRLLNWMKVYSVESDLAVKWNCSENTFRHCLQHIQYLGVNLDEVRLPTRHLGCCLVPPHSLADLPFPAAASS